MRIQDNPPLHLTYCLNIHRGESWAENFAAIQTHALPVRDAVLGKAGAAAGGPFGLGLRLSAAAAAELHHADALDDFRRFLADENLYVFTINGFPYGQFHDTSVKENVYAPDWRDPRRLTYTNRLADILAALLPEGVIGTISTVPGAYKEWIRTEDDLRTMAAALAESAAYLHAVRGERDKHILLALEPEPDCYLGNMDETLAFCTGPLLELGVAHLGKDRGMDARQARRLLGRHVGLCFDTAHMAVEFEDLAAALARVAEAGVPLAKLHLSSALRLAPTPERLHRLRDFCDEVYLHQVKVRGADGRLARYADLPRALAERGDAGADEEWRIHFHVPLFFREHEGLRSTSDLFTPEVRAALTGGLTQQIEIETYTFDVLPDELRADDVVDSIAREYAWALAWLGGEA